MIRPTPDALWNEDGQVLGRRVAVYHRLDSTNTLALAHADDPANHGLAILAREQTAGRGQHGRSWQAPAGSSVLMSLLVFPSAELRRPVVLTAWAAVAVCDTLRKIANLEPRIKWPNDVLVGGKKICGILIEQRTTQLPDHALASVVGIGLNVAQSAEMFALAALTDACSLYQITGRRFDADDVARMLLAELDASCTPLMRGAFDALETDWQTRLGVVGKDVLIETHQQPISGRLLELTLSGIVLDTGGDLERLPPEAVRHIRFA